MKYLKRICEKILPMQFLWYTAAVNMQYLLNILCICSSYFNIESYKTSRLKRSYKFNLNIQLISNYTDSLLSFIHCV